METEAIEAEKQLTFDEMKVQVFESDLFKLQTKTLDDPRVKDNKFFNKLK